MGKNKIWKKMAFSLIMLSIFTLSVYTHGVMAVGGSVWPPYIQLTPTVKIFESTTETSQFEITNTGTNAAEVTIVPNDNLNDYVDINTPYVYLAPGEMKIITFDIGVRDALQHTGDIFVTFKDSSISNTLMYPNVKIYPVGGGTIANTAAPSVPSDLTPRMDYCSRDVTVSWTHSTDSDTNTLIYEFELDNNNDFSSKLDDGIVIGNEKTFHLEPGLYFWRIRAYDGLHRSAWIMSSFKINEPLECMDKLSELESRIDELENRFDLLEALVGSLKSALCTINTFQFCGGVPQECAGTNTECGVGGICQNCDLLDGCYSGYYKDYSCSSQSCAYTSTCTESCCDAFHGDSAAYCSAGVCNAPGGPSCTDECTDGTARCSGDTRQTCDDHDQDGCTEWGDDQFCENGCDSGECLEACSPKGETCSSGDDCCSGSCYFGKTCISYDLRGVCNRYIYDWACL